MTSDSERLVAEVEAALEVEAAVAPIFAVGDGIADDRYAIQAALEDRRPPLRRK